MLGSAANVIENIRRASDPYRSLGAFSPSFAATSAPSLCPVIKSRFPVISASSRSRFAFYLFTFYLFLVANAFSMLFSRLYYAFVKTPTRYTLYPFFLISGNTGKDGVGHWDVRENYIIA